jgi:hypothetical protein
MLPISVCLSPCCATRSRGSPTDADAVHAAFTMQCALTPLRSPPQAPNHAHTHARTGPTHRHALVCILRLQPRRSLLQLAAAAAQRRRLHGDQGTDLRGRGGASAAAGRTLRDAGGRRMPGLQACISCAAWHAAFAALHCTLHLPQPCTPCFLPAPAAHPALVPPPQPPP